jgi:ParB family chromosome partitioning protein
MKRQALGKGLSSLIPESSIDKGEAGLLMLDIDRLQPSRFQPRSDFGGLEELAESIRQNGIVQPVVVRQEGNNFHLIAGERRWRAAQLAGVHRIPAVVRKVADDRVLEMALVENIQRKDLNPIEEARAYEELLDRMKLTQGDVATRVGRDRSSIANSLRLLKLPKKIQGHLSAGLLSVGHAKAIMALPGAETQIRVADAVVAKLLSVRETEALVAEQMGRTEVRPVRGARPRGEGDHNVSAAAEKLCRALATRVRIVKRGGRGKIEIEFYSDGELDRLYSFLMTAKRGH